MALVQNIKHLTLQTHNEHSEAECTYDIVTDPQTGERALQIDTYGSKQRQIIGKKSQSLRLSKSAIADLKQIIQSQNL